MNTIAKKISVLATVFLTTVALQAQSTAWKKVSESRVSSSELLSRNSEPTNFNVFELNHDAFNRTLLNAPDRSTNRSSNVTISLPSVDGTLADFKVFKTSTLSEGLRLRYPGINSYVAKGIKDPTAIAHISVGTNGVHAMILSGNHPTVYVEPYTINNRQYIQYSRSEMGEPEDRAVCEITEAVDTSLLDLDELESLRNADDGQLRTFRLALACTGEYAQYHLNRQMIPSSATDAEKRAAVLSEYNTAMTRVNGLFERDVAITMVLISNTDDLIYLNGGTDPYTNNSGFTMLDENQNNINSVIGFANYDIGHVFSTGGGGVAQLRSPCTSGKARGVTGLPQPVNDGFYVDFVAHEMGHQYGANHTFNSDASSCGGGNRNASTAFEPGSGSTIMAYAGICPPENVQNFSDDYFTGISVIEMFNNVSSGPSSSCPTTSATNNEAPIADAGPNYTIPSSTPFILEGSATDSDSSSLTYCWEQRDNQLAPAPPQSTSTVGPNFRSFDPQTSPDRYMPSLNIVLNGSSGSTWERLPSVTRIMRFRLTVRDNEVGGGALSSDINSISVDGNSGPFVVTSQNATGTVWTTQTTETITWNVAGTDAAPVNTSTVDILFSEDGGQNFDRVIVSGTPNDGSEEINVPTVNTTTGRFMIRASENIYYDVNNRDIVVTGSLGVDDFNMSDLAIYPNPSDGLFNVSFSANTGKDVNISMYDVRGRLIDTQVFTNPSSNFNERIDYSNLNSGMYFVTITNGDQQTTKKITIQ
ncbi:reprolysin-like metallopeptidase [Jejudonia soesokkakensis]|uniref:Reprolysin-like metallopeptidase n=1 Tax=Jejudonia soesokkakensis TaxID=1323432 RepID=A0ABW2MRU4_9FLAO